MKIEIEIRNAITEICIEKSNRRIFPVQALDFEIFRAVDHPVKEIKKSLRELVRTGSVTCGRTGTGYYFKNVPKK